MIARFNALDAGSDCLVEYRPHYGKWSRHAAGTLPGAHSLFEREEIPQVVSGVNYFFALTTIISPD